MDIYFTKEEILDETTAALFGFGASAVPNDMWKVIRGPGAIVGKIVVANGQTIAVGDTIGIIKQSGDGSIPLSAFSLGESIELVEGGEKVKFVVRAYNYEQAQNGAGYTLLLRDTPYKKMKAFEDGTIGNDYDGQAIDEFFSSEYFNLLDQSVRDQILETKIPYTKGSDVNGMYVSDEVTYITKKIFQPSHTEFVGAIGSLGSNVSINTEGTALFGAPFLPYQNIYLWTRTPVRDNYPNPPAVTAVSSSSPTYFSGYNASYNSEYWAWPAFCLPQDFAVTGLVYAAKKGGGDAIALQSGNAGDTIEVIYAGTVFADWITQGQQIVSDGVKGAGILDGILQVAGADSPSTKVVTGSYIGTGTYGQSNPNTINFDGNPRFLVVAGNFQSYIYAYFIQGVSFAVKCPSSSAGDVYRLTVTWGDKTVSWYSDSFTNQGNQTEEYKWIAFF